ncbi:MAG: hypothetical protein IPP64_16245 [Bacteroidetes bacterium]|nr:hypothetical protein [Bacteroidota bacterium]
MRLLKLSALFCVFAFFVAFQLPPKEGLPAGRKVSLLVAEYDDNAAANNLQHLVNYHFVDGAMVSKETVISLPTQKAGVTGNYVRFDLGKNRIYRNRYVVTSIGNVIDIKTKKLLVAERGDFIAFKGDSIVFRTNDIFKGKYYSVLDLRTEKFGKVENANYNPLPRPDVEVDETTKPFSISAYAVSGKQDVLVKDAGFGEAQPLLGDDVKRKFPIFWLDNTSFLYANFSKNQQSATIYKVNINHSIEKIGEITEIPATAANAFFEFASDGGVVYACGKGRFAIDIKKKMVTKLVNQPIGNNFFLEADENPKYGRSILYELEVIGKKWCRLENAKTVSGYAAFQSEIVMGEERYPQGVAIWNTTNKKWTTLYITNLSDIVGWVEE